MGSLLDDEGSTPAVISNTVPANAPTVGGGSNPASTLWWDGFSIAKNISDEDAEATFIALVNGVSTEMVKANNDKAVWLMDAYVPGKSAEGVSMVAAAVARNQPQPRTRRSYQSMLQPTCPSSGLQRQQLQSQLRRHRTS